MSMFLPDDRGISKPIREPVCPFCGFTVRLETAKTDEYGRATHEQCYLLKIQLEMRELKYALPKIERKVRF
jgi:hypothetical protein